MKFFLDLPKKEEREEIKFISKNFDQIVGNLLII
jgi:hypothetical protein